MRQNSEHKQSYLVELINERKHSNEKHEKRDLLSNLVNANEEFSVHGEQRLGEGELLGTCQPFIQLPTSVKLHCVGDVFMFYIAGHEVRSHCSIWIVPRSHRFGVTDIWTYSLFRPQHASSASRRARGTISTYSKRPPRWPLASTCTKPWSFGILSLIAFAGLRRHTEA